MKQNTTSRRSAPAIANAACEPKPRPQERADKKADEAPESIEVEAELVDVPADLRKATTEELLYVALAGDSGGDIVAHGLDSVNCELEVLYEALSFEQPWACDALCQVQARIRVLAELHRRQIERLSRPTASA